MRRNWSIRDGGWGQESSTSAAAAKSITARRADTDSGGSSDQTSVLIHRDAVHFPGSRTAPAASVYNGDILIVRYGGVVVKFKPLLDRWKKQAVPERTVTEYRVRLSLDDAARLHALSELFPGPSLEMIVTDLLSAGLDELAAAMPYEPGPKIISRDDQGDPLYEDIGLTPRFVELTREFKKNLAAQARKPQVQGA